MKSLMSFLQVVLDDIGDRCGTSTSRDLKTITARYEHEGLSFLTITLADFGKDFQKSLSLGRVGPDHFTLWDKSGSTPRFLGEMLDRVFDRKTGTLIDVPSVECIRSIRQLSLMWAKIHVDCSPKRVESAYRGFINCESEVRTADANTRGTNLSVKYAETGRFMFRDLFAEVDRKIYLFDIIPGHGPGATADRLLGNEKYDLTYWPSRLDVIFPFEEYAIPSWNALDRVNHVNFAEPGAEIPVRVIDVPKTLKTPRIIAIEPTAMQYMQQGLDREIRAGVKGHKFLSHLIGLDDQVPNQRLSRDGSISGALATLDLSEASDRVSNQHVRALLENHPWLGKAVDSCRSRKADVPGHGVIRLAKFASMGSALCFPFEAIVFLTLIVTTISDELNVPVSDSLLSQLVGKVRVYGDDIIVPVEFVQSVIRNLELFGFKVNRDKSFWTGKFRESCGKDWYDGQDVTPVRVRRLFPSSRNDAREIVSVVSLRNQLDVLGYDKTVAWLDAEISGLIPFPRVGPQSPVLGRHSQDHDVFRHDTALQRPLVKGAMLAVELPRNEVDGYGALQKWILQTRIRDLEGNGLDVKTSDPSHLLRSGRPNIVRIKIGWASSL